MNKLTVYLIAGLASAALLAGAVALGNVLRSDEGAVAAPESVAIAAATPAEPDSGSDGPATIQLPRPSANHLHAHLVVPNDAGYSYSGTGVATDTEQAAAAVGGSPDEDDPQPYRPPTVPGGLDDDGRGEPDPEAPYERADWAEDIPAEELFEGPFDDASLLDWPIFRDPCADVSDADADEAEEACPDGLGGTVLLIDDGTPPDPLAISGQFYEGLSVPAALRCENLGTGDDNVYRPLFASNNPADFTIRYWLTSDPGTTQEVSYRSPDSELDWWIERRIAGDPTWANPHSGVQNCPELPLPEPMPANAHLTFEIDGVDGFGSNDSVRFYGYLDGRQSRLDRPPVSFNQRRGHRMLGVFAVPYDPTTEMVYMASIPRNGPRASDQSCTEIEGDMLDGRYLTDPSLGRFGTVVMARAAGAPEHDPRFSLAATGELWAEEGTRYQLCAWVATPAERSFDRPTVVHRSSFLVRAPRHLRVRVSVGGGHADRHLEARSVWVTAANWERDGRGTFPTQDVSAGRAFMLDAPVPMFDSGGAPVPPSTVLEVRGPTGATQLLEVRTRTTCMFPSSLIDTCPSRGVSQYDVAIPGPTVGTGLCGSSFGSCDPPRADTVVGNLRLVVERYAGPSGPPTGGDFDDWQIFPHGSFAPGDPAERPDTPQIDTNSSQLREYRWNPDGRPGLLAILNFDRPVRIEATPWDNNVATCLAPGPQAEEEYRSSHTLRWDELCHGGAFSMSLLAVDEDGNELDLRTHVDGEFTGYPGWGYVVLSAFPLAEFSLDVSIDRLGDGIRPQSLNVSVGGVSAGTFIAAGHPPRCRTEAVPSSEFTRVIRSDGGRPIGWGDSVVLFLEVAGTGDTYNCGLDERFVRIRLREELRLDDLLAGDHTFVYDEHDSEITVTVRDVRPT